MFTLYSQGSTFLFYKSFLYEVSGLIKFVCSIDGEI